MKTQTRILFLSVIALVVALGVVPQTCTASPVTVIYSENANDFRLRVSGLSIDANFRHSLILGTDWIALVTVDETAGSVRDLLTISGTARHLTGPHGEVPNTLNFPFNFSVNAADFAAGFHRLPSQSLIIGHGDHFDQFIGSLSFTVTVNVFGLHDIMDYQFELKGEHTLTNDPIFEPEPATLLLLGTGLAGVAIKTRKRLKGLKS